MTQNRRDFIKTSTAFTLFTVSNAAAQGTLAASPRKIGIVTSITFDRDLENCFLAGLSDAGWQKPPPPPVPPKRPISLPIPSGGANPGEARGQYGGTFGHSVLAKLVRDHGRQPDLIVVAGGLASHLAAFSELSTVNIPFVYLAGRLPPTSAPVDGKYCGVILNYSAQHANAVTMLNVNPSGVWLVQNANSNMSGPECTDWQHTINSNCFSFFRDPLNPVNNNALNYPGEVTKLLNQNPRPTGVVVSSDPFFRSTAPAFATAMKNGLGMSIPICYPFEDFPRSGPDILLPNRAILRNSNNPADPTTAYFQLGKLAGSVLNVQTPGHPIPSAPVPSIQWDGTAWMQMP